MADAATGAVRDVLEEKRRHLLSNPATAASNWRYLPASNE